MPTFVAESSLVSAGPHQTLTGLSSAKGINPPPDANYVRMQAVTQTVRYLDDGTDPTASDGMRLLADGSGEWYTAEIHKLRFIEEAPSATVNLLFYKPGTPGLPG
jgi:hypothetical protein